MWWIDRQLRLERETACDDWAVNAKGSPWSRALPDEAAAMPGRPAIRCSCRRLVRLRADDEGRPLTRRPAQYIDARAGAAMLAPPASGTRLASRLRRARLRCRSSRTETVSAAVGRPCSSCQPSSPRAAAVAAQPDGDDRRDPECDPVRPPLAPRSPVNGRGRRAPQPRIRPNAEHPCRDCRASRRATRRIADAGRRARGHPWRRPAFEVRIEHQPGLGWRLVGTSCRFGCGNGTPTTPEGQQA